MTAALPFESGDQPEDRHTQAARHGLAAVRAALNSAAPCPPDCPTCSADWQVENHAIGPCCVCGEPCRSKDPAGLMRHLMCEPGEGEG